MAEPAAHFRVADGDAALSLAIIRQAGIVEQSQGEVRGEADQTFFRIDSCFDPALAVMQLYRLE